jgi:uncharacterized protein YaaR (DUF327 family)
MLDKEIITLAQGLYSPLFATKESIKESISYAYSIAKGSDNPAAVTTALHVVLNTIAQHLEDQVRAVHRAEMEAFELWANQESREG